MDIANAPELVPKATAYQTYAQHALEQVLEHSRVPSGAGQQVVPPGQPYSTVTSLLAELVEWALTFSLRNGHRPRRAD